MKKILSILAGVVVLSLFGGTIYFLWAKSQKPETVFQTESPRRTDTSPFIRLTRATPRPGPSSEFCAHTGAPMPAATTKVSIRAANMAV